ncbi:cysteine peptidase family C39 domain-containing protein [Gimesia sp.]|uniref:cysteine peptidase family C39 domain-containing protein n=1 Tax=Gimesia sp. TaxID=2024833 RepID=UPI0032EC1437
MHSIFIVVSFLVATTNSVSNDSEIVWRSERVCGINSLYFLLVLTNHEADYLDMQRSLLKEELVSLDDIKRTAELYGLPVRIALCTPNDLKAMQDPVIAHFDTVNFSGSRSGHFVVIYDTDDKGVKYLDGTTGELMFVTWRNFERSWSGYAVFPIKSHQFDKSLSVFSFLCGAMCGYLFTHRKSKRFLLSKSA